MSSRVPKNQRRFNKRKLVVNKAAPTANVTKNVLQRFAANAKASLVRNGEMTGRKFKVVPMVMIVEGVLNGSNGPLFYPKDEMAVCPEAWDHKPVVVNHPDSGVSACSPEELTKRKVGYIFNTKFEKVGRLKAEAWIDIELANNVDKRIVEAIDNEETLELSTGLFTDNENTPGTHDGVAYDAIARNYRPDHLAILPDNVGACSKLAGAGFIRNAAAKIDTTIPKDLLEMCSLRVVAELTGNYNPIQPRDGKGTFGEGDEDDVTFNEGYAAQRGNLTGDPIPNPYTKEEDAKKAWNFQRGVNRAQWHAIKGVAMNAEGKPLTENEMSLETRRSQLYGKLKTKLSPKKEDYCCAWIEDVYSSKFIYSYQGKLFSQGYTATETVVELEGDPEEVVRVTEYRTPKGAFVGNRKTSTQSKQVINMDKTKIINGLIANSESGWTEEDRATLAAFSNEKLAKLAANAGIKPEKQEEPKKEPATNAAPAAATPAAPALNAEQSEALAYGQKVLAANKQKAIAAIKLNKANTFSDATLNKMSIEDLESLAAIAAVPAPVANTDTNDQSRPFFGGQAEVRSTTENAKSAEDGGEALPMPTMNFGAEDKS